MVIIRTLGKSMAILFLIACTANHQQVANETSEITLEIIDQEAAKVTSLRSVLIGKKREIIFEKYYGQYSGDSLDHVRSVTKSITGLLIGIAIDQGHISHVNESIELHLKDFSGFRKEHAEITIHHLLTMSGGFDWNENNVSTFNTWVTAADPVRYLLDRRLVQKPGAQWVYNSACSHLLSVILTEATGMDTRNFAQSYLFEPLGINNFRWQKINGYFNGGAGLELRPQDMVKIGQLVLGEGQYRDEQVISADYVRNAISPQIAINNDLSYGYQWTIETSQDFRNAMAEGYGGQFVVVLPEIDVVLAGTNQWRVSQTQAQKQAGTMAQLFKNYVLPYVLNNLEPEKSHE